MTKNDNHDFYLGSYVELTKNKNYLIGAINQAIEYGANTFMFYTGSPKVVKKPPLADFKINEFHKLCNKYKINIEKLVIHCSYLINIANTIKQETYNLGIGLLINEIYRANQIGIKTIVLHPGSAVGAEKKVALDKLIEGLKIVLSETSYCDVKIALETMCGKGTQICINFKEIAYVLNNVKSDRVGVCWDTCHLFDAGYSLDNIDELIKKFEEHINFNKIFVVHLNDSKNELGSKKDIHENIGNGKIGFDPLYNLVHHEKFKQIPFILETPWIENNTKPLYKQEIEMLRNRDIYDSSRK